MPILTTFKTVGEKIMLRLLAYLYLVAAVAGCAVEPKDAWRVPSSEPEAGERPAVVPAPNSSQVHDQANKSGAPQKPYNTTHYAVKKDGECDFSKPPVRECSAELKTTLTVVGERLNVRMPVCGEFVQSYETPDPVTQGTRPAQIEVAGGGESISVGSIYDTVIIRDAVVHEPVIRPASERSVWDGGINVVLSCLVYPMTK